MEKGLLLVTRTFTVKEAFLPGNDWAEYQKLTKSATTDETQYLRLIRTSTAIGSAPENQNPAELNSTIAALLQNATTRQRPKFWRARRNRILGRSACGPTTGNCT